MSARDPSREGRSISALLRAGGIVYDIDATKKLDVLREVVARLPLPNGLDRKTLLAAVEAREAIRSTGIGDGIAIPHTAVSQAPRSSESFVTLALLRKPIDFNAVDGQRVHAVFFVMSSSPSDHIRTLGKLGRLFRDNRLRGLLRRRAAAEEILQCIDAIEQGSLTGA